MNWSDYIEIKNFLKYRCKFCRMWFEEKDDVKIHIKNCHEIKVEIKACGECKNPFVPIYKDQVICGRKECLLKN